MTIAGECPNVKCSQDLVDIIATYMDGRFLKGHKCRCPDCGAVWVLHIA